MKSKTLFAALLSVCVIGAGAMPAFAGKAGHKAATTQPTKGKHKHHHKKHKKHKKPAKSTTN